MGYAVNINLSNFNQEVLQASYFQPVLIDFYATWCGPCQLLKPLLEKLLKEYDFILAKVDIDQNPQLAHQFNVEGVPDVRVVVRGEILPGFVGVLAEAQIRDLLSRLNLKSELEMKLEDIKLALSEQNYRQGKELFDQLLEKYPDNPLVILEASYFLLKLNYLEEAEKISQTISPEPKDYYAKAQYLQTLIHLKRLLKQLGDSELDGLFRQGIQLTLAEDYENAFPVFLEIVRKNRQYQQDGARKALVALFHWLGMEHPLTKQYQQELMTTLY